MAPFVRVGKYIVKKKIGEGAFAEVRLAAHEETGEEYAVKVFNRSLLPKTEFEREVKKEIRIMQHLRHPNIVSIHAVLVTATKMYLVMELVRGGELYDEIVSNGRIDEDTSRKYFQQLVDAMTYCHRRGVVHRDLKPENLLLDGNGNLKVTDFGMSWMKAGQDPNKMLLSTQCGTPKYMAPEVIMRPPGGYDGRKSDVWEIGMVLYALLAGFLPFTGDDDNAVFRSILNGRVKFPSFFSDGAKEILRLMLDKDPNTRSTLEEVRKHPWFRVNYQGDITRELSTAMSKMVSEVPASIAPRPSPSPRSEEKPASKITKPAANAAPGNENDNDREAMDTIIINNKENVNNNVPHVHAPKPERKESVLRVKLRAAHVQIPGLPPNPAPASASAGPAGMLSPVSQWRQDVQMDLGEMEREATATLAEEQVASNKSPLKAGVKGFKVKFNFPSPNKKKMSAHTTSDASGNSPSPAKGNTGGRAATPDNVNNNNRDNEGRTGTRSGRLAKMISGHSNQSMNAGANNANANCGNDGNNINGNSSNMALDLDVADREDGEAIEPADSAPTSKSYFPALRIPSLKTFSPMRSFANTMSTSPRSEDEGSSVRSIFRGIRLGGMGSNNTTPKGDRANEADAEASYSSWFSPASADNSPRTIVGDVPESNNNADNNQKNNKMRDSADPNASPSSVSWKSFYRSAFSRGE